MATRTVWKFNDADGAEKVEDRLHDLQRQELIQIHDAVGTAVGAMAGAAGGLLADVGIESTSASEVIKKSAEVPGVTFARDNAELIYINLSDEDAARL